MGAIYAGKPCLEEHNKVEMLDLNPETVYFIIDKAHEFQIMDEVDFPDDATGPDDIDIDAFAPHAEDPVFAELKATIEDLEPDQQVSLVTLMWIGRGDYAPEEWEQAMQHAAESWTERTAEYLIGTPLLSDFLSNGLELLGYERE